MSFIERINRGELLLLDGGMGSLLAAKGAGMESGLNNLKHPDIVESAHREYIEAGSDCIISNTFTLNDIYARRLGIDETEPLVRSGMEIALRAAEKKAYVLGDLGPTGEMLKPLGAGDADEFHRAYLKQAKIMAEYPLDAFIVETVFDLNEALIMLAACKEAAPNIPVIMSLTFSTVAKGGRTIMGNKAAVVAKKARENQAAMVGANCGDLTPAEYALILREMADCGLPLVIQPNAGKPELVGQEVTYPLTPQLFAQEVRSCYDAGARLIGGCCGTTPAHIAAVKSALK